MAWAAAAAALLLVLVVIAAIWRRGSSGTRRLVVGRGMRSSQHQHQHQHEHEQQDKGKEISYATPPKQPLAAEKEGAAVSVVADSDSAAPLQQRQTPHEDSVGLAREEQQRRLRDRTALALRQRAERERREAVAVAEARAAQWQRAQHLDDTLRQELTEAAHAAGAQREYDSLLRKEQDEAYQASLQADREREEARRREQERLHEEESRRQRELEAAADREQAIKAAKESKRASLPPEPARTNPKAIALAVRLLDGSTARRVWLSDTSVGSLFDWTESMEEVGEEQFALVVPCVGGKRRLQAVDKDRTLVEAGISTNTMLYLEKMS